MNPAIKKLTMVASCAAATVLAATAPRPNARPMQSNHHVPARLDKVRLISPAAANVNHILLVNVADAIPADAWPLVATYATSRLQLNVWTNSVDVFAADALLGNPLAFRRMFGDKAKVAVFIENSPAGAPVTCAPGFWSRVNLNGIDGDKPDVQTLRDRYAKMILKGMAYASGGGASVDPTCSLCYSSLSLKGLDACGISISPSTYFPMLEILRQAGGSQMLSPAHEE